MRTATPVYAELCSSNWVTKATIYENGVSIGTTNAIHDHSERKYSFDGKRWKVVEFSTKGEHVRRWLIFADATQE